MKRRERIGISREGGLRKLSLHDFSNYQIGKAKCQYSGLLLEHPFISFRNSG